MSKSIYCTLIFSTISGFCAYRCFKRNYVSKITKSVSMASHDPPSPWSHLPDDILDLIFDCTKDPIDILRCGAVCKSWRPTAFQVYQKFFPLCFIQPDKNRDDDNFVLFNILNKETRKIQLPETKGKSIVCGYNGWLLTLDHSASSPVMHLLNIFSRTQILLPPTSSLPKPFPDKTVDFKGKLHLSKSPTSSDCRVLLRYDHEGQRIFSTCKPGRRKWFWSVLWNSTSNAFLHTTSNNRFYISMRLPPLLFSQYGTTPVPELANSLEDRLWLVCYKTEHPEGKFFDVFELEKETAKKNRKLKDLDGCTLFVSPNGCHIAKNGNFKANCIYFIRQSEGGCLIYDMETGHSEIVLCPGLVGDGNSLISWVIPDVPSRESFYRRFFSLLDRLSVWMLPDF